tara:strand:+ start:430 stop:756 length:327 start_codon:yes stop_codon:yes gene_type:complete
MATINNTRKNDNNKNQFSPSNRSSHRKRCAPDMEEFSKLLKSVPEDILFNELATHQQRLLAQSLWEACNYGGKPKPGNFKDMEPKRDYLEWVLRIDHEDQWCKFLEKG